MFNALVKIIKDYDYSKGKLEIDFHDLKEKLHNEGHELTEKKLPYAIKLLESATGTSVVIADVPPNTDLRDLDSKDVSKYFSTMAMIKTITEINPVLVTEVYVCKECGTQYEHNLESETQNPLPSKCSCGGVLVFSKEESVFRDEKYLTLEEPLELRRDGLSRSFRGHIQGYEASSKYNLKAGDVCMISGVVDVEEDRKRNLRFILELNHIDPVSYSFDDIELQNKDIQKILELSTHQNLFQELVDSIAPDIFGYDSIKEGIVLQLFEGNRNYDGERSFMHILLIGEPGLGKSKLVGKVKEIAPKVITTSGTNATKVGLTVSTNRDELTGKWTADAGAVVLGDRGVLLIDEFDKLPYDAKTSINEPMESGTVSLSKAGLTQTLTARSSILAAANPKYGHYDDDKPLRDQLQIPDSTLSRFDLVYIMKDTIDEDNDRELSRRILNSENMETIPPVSSELFRNYIAYAKANFNPVLTNDASEVLSEFYVKVRQEAKQEATSKPITARDLNAIKRLASAYAKLHLRDEILVDDVKEAIRIYSDSLETLGLTVITANEFKEDYYSENDLEAIGYLEKRVQADFEEYGRIENASTIKVDTRMEYGLSSSVVNKFFEEVVKNYEENS